ncbi:MAG: hypothetical protein ACXVA6_17640, partial [Isosphaeraceae bacterium]
GISLAGAGASLAGPRAVPTQRWGRTRKASKGKPACCEWAGRPVHAGFGDWGTACDTATVVITHYGFDSG